MRYLKKMMWIMLDKREFGIKGSLFGYIYIYVNDNFRLTITLFSCRWTKPVGFPKEEACNRSWREFHTEKSNRTCISTHTRRTNAEEANPQKQLRSVQHLLRHIQLHFACLWETIPSLQDLSTCVEERKKIQSQETERRESEKKT